MSLSEGPKHFTDITDLARPELDSILRDAAEIDKEMNPWKPRNLLNRQGVAYYSSKGSNRTEGSIQQAASFLGGYAFSPGPNALFDETGKPREIPADIARSAEAQRYRIIFARLHQHSDLLAMQYALTRASIVNALTNESHPLQALADALAIRLARPKVERPKVVFSGPGNNVATSLGEISAMLGYEFIHAGPEDKRRIPEARWERMQNLAEKHDGSVRHEADPYAAVPGATLVYTDVPASMGEKEHAEELNDLMKPYAVTQKLMDAAGPQALFGHCLPAQRGVEVDAGVIDGERSIVWRIADLRVATTAAVIQFLIKENSHRGVRD
jgi:ornithine carbamoyltransferase